MRNIDLVKKLIEAEVSLTIRNDDGYTALSYAASCAKYLNTNTYNYEYNVEALELLIAPSKSAGVLDSCNNEGKTAIMIVDDELTDPFRTDILTKLKDAGAKPEKTDLMIACTNRESVTAESLIGPTVTSGSIDVQDRNGFSALMMAAANDLSDVVRKLIESGAKVDLKSSLRAGGHTALQIGANNGHAMSTDYLIVPSKLASVLDHQDGSGETALMSAGKKGLVGCVSKMIEEGANVALLDNYGM